jgi:type I restriction enzyme R subunit
MKSLSERDICTKLIVPAVHRAGWDIQRQVREEVTFTKGRVIVRGKLHVRGKARRADFVLYHQANLPLAVIEAKDNSHGPGDGMQQALDLGADGVMVPLICTREEAEQSVAFCKFPPQGKRSVAYPTRCEC